MSSQQGEHFYIAIDREMKGFVWTFSAFLTESEFNSVD